MRLFIFLFIWAFSALSIHAQTVTITQPNGGEVLYACQQYTVKWNQTGSPSNYWNIDYSLDGGTIWTSVASNYLSTNGQFLWTVPNVQSSTVIMRVFDANLTTTVDQSNNVFTINIPIVLISPNGGEVWQGQTVHNITWNMIGTSNSFNIYYSTDNGTNWNAIAYNYSTGTGSYAWTVPTIPPSTNCLVMVQDAAQPCMQDISALNFSITSPTPILLTPNGGETLHRECTYAITWNANTFYSNVRLDYSTDGGTTWVNITTSTSNDGTQNWTVPSVTSTQCRVKVSQTSNLSLFDISDANFTIAVPVTITTPNGGESWIGCNTYPITFTKSNCISYWNIYYSTDNGVTWNFITYVSTNNLLSQTYSWQVPNSINTTQARFKIENYYNVNEFDISDAAFTITPSNDITVSSPNGGENWLAQSVQSITWTNTAAASGQYNIYYSLDNGVNFYAIAYNVTGNAYNWTVINSPSTSCLIRVQDAVNTCKYDNSNAVFTIGPLTPLLLTPNGGISIYSGTTYAITWNANTFYSNVRLDYSTDGGTTWINITTSTSNDGTQNWTVPQSSSSNCLVKVSQTNDLSRYDTSDTVFTIKPAVTIITPNGDNGVTIWGGCTVTSITFDRSPAWDAYSIDYSLNNGATWTNITSYWSTTANPATYNWTMPNSPSSNVRVRVTPYYANTYGDTSDNTFTITKPVTIIQPNFGGIMQVGTTYNIQWSSDGISNIYDVFYSTNGGTSFTNIVLGYNTSNNTYPWSVPNLPSNNCRIWVRDNINYCKADTSDIAFIISTNPAPLTLTSPNGNSDVLVGCSTKIITWTETSAIGTYDIDYSLNNGTTWINVVSNYATATLNYNWIVPNNINSSSVLLRVKASGNANNFDLSDAYFSIVSGSLVATPASISECYGVPIQLNATGGSNYTWSPALGLSTTNIANPVATPNASTTYTVTSNNSGCILTDQVAINITTGGTTASVNISSNVTGTVCAGTNITFTADVLNEGDNPHYQWLVNGANVGADASTYSSNSLPNNAQVSCVLTSNLPCVAGSPATSNTIVVNVASVTTPSVSIIASPGATVCQGEQVVFTAQPSNGGSAPVYQWKLNGNNVGTDAPTYSNAALITGDIVSVQMISNESCVTSTNANSSGITLTVNAYPALPAAINGLASICANASANYSINPVAGATSYTWTLPNGWAGSSASNSISIVPNVMSGSITVAANNACGSGPAQLLSVSVSSVPDMPSGIAGATSVCQNVSEMYSIPSVLGATSYLWTLPSGWSGASNTNDINITFGNSAANGTLQVIASNACGNSAPQSLSVSVGSITSATGLISGAAEVCASAINSYTVENFAGAISYTWSLPIGWTGNSTANTISVANNGADGSISVVANTNCGSSQPSFLSINAMNIPESPLQILGSSLPCANSQQLYEATQVADATSYLWTLPSGWAGAPSGNLISVNTNAIGGQIQVAAQNICGTSSEVSLLVDVANAPEMPMAITGTTELCANEVATYSISEVSSADSYTWTLPIGWSGASNTSSIMITAANNEGAIQVVANNECGSSEAQTINVSVNNAPAMPSAISGSAVVCSGDVAVYSVVNDPNALSYSWTLPFGWSGTSAVNTVEITANDMDGIISVTAINNCGVSAAQTINVVSTTNVPTLQSINGPSQLCPGAAAVYSVPNTTTAESYTWSLPAGWAGVSSSSSISVVSNEQSGTISVYATNGCGNSAVQTLSVTSLPLPQIGATASPSNSICQGSSVALNGTGGVSYQWNQGIGNGDSFVLGNTGTFTVTGTDANNCTATASITVTVNMLPTVSLNLNSVDVQCLQDPAFSLGGGLPLNGSFSGQGVTGGVFNPAAAGLGIHDITYTYIDGNGCSNYAIDFITVQTCPHVLDMQAELDAIAVYPNPNNGMFTLEFSNQSIFNNEKFEVFLIDAFGNIVMNQNISAVNTLFDVSNVASGIYSMQIRSQNAMKIMRIEIAK